ncbi:hypothetical protein HY994_00285 [Candidatus Micrarchaeota archaeon]|nr:hypothetical protein [Candidatus Micrarchaeota archaeon]
MPFGEAIYNLLPNMVYEVIHFVALILGLFLAKKCMDMGAEGKAWMPLFVLYGLSELGWLLVHTGVFAWQFAHLLQEVFLLVGMVLGAMAMKGKK